MAVTATHSARVSILQLALRNNAPVNIGVLLEDLAADRLFVRLRRDWELIAPEEAEVLSLLETSLETYSSEGGSASVIERPGAWPANTILISEPREAVVEDFERSLARLYREHVHSETQPYRTHLPR